MRSLNARIDRIERAIGDIGGDECPLCRWQSIITFPPLPEAPAQRSECDPNHWPDCFDETGHCRRCGREADRVEIRIAGDP